MNAETKIVGHVPLSETAQVLCGHLTHDLWKEFEAERNALFAKCRAKREAVERDYASLSAIAFIEKYQ